MDWKTIVLIAVCIIIGGMLRLALLSLTARRPAILGITNGRLTPCPNKRNCVSTQALDARHRIEPLRFEGGPEEAMDRLRAVLTARPRVRIVTQTDTYLHAECTSLLFRFVDDVEFLVDPTAKVIHFRSASRVGRGDLGVNRRRMEEVRQAFNAACFRASRSGE